MSIATHPDPPAGDRWVFLATTNRGLESVAVDEIAALTGETGTVAYPGMVRFSGDLAAVYSLHARARSIHRVMLELCQGHIETLDDITELIEGIDTPAYLGSDQAFAVRAKRRGDHPFGSPDVERAVGQAIIDGFRADGQARPPVDLDDPEMIFRVIIRENRATVAIDATGQRSLHRRWYRLEEHDAALRPTIAYAMCQYAGYDSGDRLLDPMCGCGTIPIEAALAAMDRPPTIEHEPALTRFRFLDVDRYHRLQETTASEPEASIVASDLDERAIEATRRNVTEADVADVVTARTANATAIDIDTDLVVTDLPFGIRTSGNLSELYSAFFENLRAGEWDRAVVHTAREDLVPLEVSTTVPMRRGRLETSILVIE